MKNRRSVNRLFRNPVVMGMTALTMIIMILAVVVYSAKIEERLKHGHEPEEDPHIRPPDYSADVTISPPSDEEVIISEDGNDPSKKKSSGIYLNNKRLSVSTGYGMTFSLGMEDQSETDAIYLNPHFEYIYAGNPDEAYGYLIRTERAPLEYAESTAAPAWTGEHHGLTDFAIVGRTYDKVVPASVQSREHYGVRWVDSPAYGGLEHAGDTVRILIIRISDGTLMGAVSAEIDYDYGKHSYSLKNLINSDVSFSGKLSDEQRGELIEKTVQVLVQGNDQMTLDVSPEELNAQSTSIVVDHSRRTYYSKLYDMVGNVVSSGTFSKCDIYAVNINCDGYGFFTVYFAPEPQANGLAMETLKEGETVKLVPIGYDAFAPFTMDSFSSFLHPDDKIQFGVE